MKTRTSPVILGFIWGMFSMLLSFAVVSVFASLQLSFIGFPLFAYNAQMQYILIGAVFLLSVVGAIGAGIVPRLPKLGGTLILLSCAGVALFLFVPVLAQTFSFEPLRAYGISIGPLALLITDFAIIFFTVIGLAGGILAFIPKKDRKAQLSAPAHHPAPAETAPVHEQAPIETIPVPQAQSPAPPPAAPPEIAHAAPPPADIGQINME